MHVRVTFSVLAVVVALTPLQALSDEPADEKIQWLKDQAIPFKTVEAGNGLADLQPLKKVIGDARIVSLGESTHGSREIFQMKHRLVEFLAMEMGFTIFSIEASMPESYRVNDYVVRGEGDPRALIAGMYFWTWNTEEVLDMVEWMRSANKQQPGSIEFTGFDMQEPRVAMQNVVSFLQQQDAGLHEMAKQAYEKARRATQSSVQEFGVATGTFPVAEARGKRVTLSGWIETQDVQKGFAGLWWRADGKNGKVLAFDNMAKNGPRGTQDWKRYSIELDVPAETSNINFGVILPGEGKAWFDGLEVTLDGKAYQDAELFDLDFESKELKGLASIPRRTYRTRIDNKNAKVGNQSLLLESVKKEDPDAILATEGLKLSKQVLAGIEQSRDTLSESVDKKKLDWILQNARVVSQCMEMRVGLGGQVRDRCMAENIAWILEQNPRAKIVLWAHNGHVAKRQFAMGKYLDKRFGEEHLAIAFATSNGKYRAIKRGTGLTDNVLQAPPMGSVEDIFSRAGIPVFGLDLRKVEVGSRASGWLAKPTAFRGIGAMAMDRQFFPQNLHQMYDAVIYIEETTASRSLKP
jgi:erythromycin esterase-like protein